MLKKYYFILILNFFVVFEVVESLIISKPLKTEPVPFVLWHGMGDTCCDGMLKIANAIEESRPRTFVYSIQIGQDDSQDRKAGFLDNMNRQIEEACEKIKSQPELTNGYHAIGLSQGGLFLRGLAQRCSSPRMKSLFTIGSPHGGVASFPGCLQGGSIHCTIAKSLLLNGAYVSWVQSRVVQAQYFKDPKKTEAYLEKNIFLVDINNQRGSFSESYKKNLVALEHFAMVMFDDDDIVVPKESAWFGNLNENLTVVDIKDQQIYQEDRLGLKYMNEHAKLHFINWPGKHLEFDLEMLISLLDKVLGSHNSSMSFAEPKFTIQKLIH